jgi:macrolide transport system ATP-binding/permease protein
MMLDTLLHDVRRAARLLRASPGLLVVSVLSLGLGLGVNLTLFGAIRAVFFYTPSIAAAERVVGVEPGNSNQYSYLNYRDLQQANIFESVAGFRRVSLNLRGREQVERVQGLGVTANFFEMLGVGAAVGRPFTAAEAAAERQPRVAVLSYRFWQRRFNEDPSVVGQRLMLNNAAFDVIGVLPESYRPISPVEAFDVYVPLSALVLPTINDRSNGNALGVLARLRPGDLSGQALVAVTALNQQLEQAYPQENRGMGQPAKLVPLQIREFGSWQEPFIISAVVMVLFGLVLLSACANVAGLLLARVARRQREIAVRIALGARRGRLIRMLLAESFGLAGLGAVAGGILFIWFTRALSSISLPAGLGAVNLSVDLDATVGLYALLLVIATGLLCGIVPAWRATRGKIFSDIQSGESHGATGRLWMRHAFVVGQVASSITLLVISSLLIRSLMRITALDVGFDRDRGLVAAVNIEADRYAVDGGLPLGERIVDALKGMPGIQSASFAGILALGTETSATRLQVEGVDPGTVGSRTFLNSVGPDYFATLGIRLVAGREFTARDREGSPEVAIVSEAFARSYFPGQNALGKRVRRSDREPYAEIVGVVADSNHGLIGEAPTPLYYSAYTQRPRISSQIRPLVVHVRSTGSPVALLNEVRRVITALEPTAFVDVRTLRDATSSEAGLRNLGARLFGIVGIVALLLATIGLYGVMAFVVSSRTREIGTRMAIGAASGQILRGVLTAGLRLVAIGVVIGALASWLLARALVAGLAGLSPADPIAFGGAAVVLLLVGLAACYFPARRAAALNPVEALRVE